MFSFCAVNALCGCISQIVMLERRVSSNGCIRRHVNRGAGGFKVSRHGSLISTINCSLTTRKSSRRKHLNKTWGVGGNGAVGVLSNKRPNLFFRPNTKAWGEASAPAMNILCCPEIFSCSVGERLLIHFLGQIKKHYHQTRPHQY